MTRALTIFLLFFFLADAVGLVLFLLIDGHEIRKEMRSLLHSKEVKNNTITLTFDRTTFSSLSWIDYEHEFFYDGKLYDVSAIQSMGETIRITCVEDFREAEFYQRLQQAIDLGQPLSKDHPAILLSCFKFLSQLLPHSIADLRVDQPARDTLDFAYSNHYRFSFHTISLRPPDSRSFSI